MTPPGTMRAVQVTAPGRVELRRVPVPEPGPGEVLVEVAAAGVCHSDLHLWHSPRIRSEPLTLGHEIAGTIVGGDGAPGTAGVVYLCFSCGRCGRCAQGRENLCREAGRAAMPPAPGLGPAGGMADYVTVPGRAFVSTDIDPVRAAPLADAGLTSQHAIDTAREHLVPGATAVVLGVGGLGHVGLQILRALAPVRVVAVDTDPDARALAARLGADQVLDGRDVEAVVARILAATDGLGAEAVFDFVGLQQTAEIAVRTVAPGGAYRMVGLGGGDPGLAADGALGDRWPWGASVLKTYAGTRADLHTVLTLARQDLLAVHTETFPLGEGPEVLSHLADGNITGRAVLLP